MPVILMLLGLVFSLSGPVSAEEKFLWQLGSPIWKKNLHAVEPQVWVDGEFKCFYVLGSSTQAFEWHSIEDPSRYYKSLKFYAAAYDRNFKELWKTPYLEGIERIEPKFETGCSTFTYKDAEIKTNKQGKKYFAWHSMTYRDGVLVKKSRTKPPPELLESDWGDVEGGFMPETAEPVFGGKYRLNDRAVFDSKGEFLWALDLRYLDVPEREKYANRMFGGSDSQEVQIGPESPDGLHFIVRDIKDYLGKWASQEEGGGKKLFLINDGRYYGFSEDGSMLIVISGTQLRGLDLKGKTLWEVPLPKSEGKLDYVRGASGRIILQNEVYTSIYSLNGKIYSTGEAPNHEILLNEFSAYIYDLKGNFLKKIALKPPIDQNVLHRARLYLPDSNHYVQYQFHKDESKGVYILEFFGGEI